MDFKRITRLLSGDDEDQFDSSSKMRMVDFQGQAGATPRIWESALPISCASFAPSGDGYACGFSNGVIQVFPEQHEIQVEPSVPINSIAWGKTGEYLIVTTDGGDIWKWDFRKVELLSEYPLPVTSIILSPDSAFIITGADDGVIQVRDLERGLLVADIKEDSHTGPITYLGIVMNEEWSTKEIIISASQDETIRFWDWQAMATGLDALLGVINPEVGEITSLSPGDHVNSLIVSGTLGFRLMPFDFSEPKATLEKYSLKKTHFVEKGHIDRVQFVDNKIVLARHDGILQIMDYQTRVIEDFIYGRHYALISDIGINASKSLFVTTSIDGTLKIWPSVLALENNASLAPAKWDRKASRMADPVFRESKAPPSYILLKTSTAAITSNAIDAYQDSCVSLVGRADGTLSTTHTFVSNTGDEKSFCFHLRHIMEEETPVEHRNINCVAISPNFNFFVSAAGTSLQVWIYHPTKKGKKLPDRFKSLLLNHPVTALAFSADEKYLLVGTQARTIVQYRTLTLQEIDTFTMDDESEEVSGVMTCAFASTGDYMAAGTDSGLVKVWKLKNNLRDTTFVSTSVWTSSDIELERQMSSESITRHIPLHGTTSLAFSFSEAEGEEEKKYTFLAAGSSTGRIHVWKIAPRLSNKVLKKEMLSSIVTQKFRTYISEEKIPILTLRWTADAAGLVSACVHSTKLWNFSKRMLGGDSKFNPFGSVLKVGMDLTNLNKGELKKREATLLEETVPWHIVPYSNTLGAAFGSMKNFLFVARTEEDNAMDIEPISCLPILFWHTFTMKIPESTERTFPILWLSQRRGNLYAVKRIVEAATPSMLYVTNQLEQVPYLFAVKCGDDALMRLTVGPDRALDKYSDILGRNAIFFSVFSIFSARALFKGSAWYSTTDMTGCPPVHYAILNGREEVVSHILFNVIPKLSEREQRLVFESYDHLNRTPLMLLVEKYPIFAKKVLDMFGIQKAPFESGGKENVMVRVIYNLWLVTPYEENEGSSRNRTLHLIAHHDRKDLTSHPLLVYTFEKKKWQKLVGPVFFVEFFLQLFIVAILVFASIFSNTRLDLGTFYETVFTGTGWYVLQLSILVLAALDLAWRMFVPIRNLVVLRTLDLNYRTVSYLVIYAVLIFSIVGNLSSTRASSSIILSIINLLLMLNVMSYLPLFPGIGPVVLGVLNTLAPILYWASFFLVVFIAFSVTMTAISSKYSPLNYSTIYWTMNTLFLGMFGQGDPFSDILDAQDGLGITLFFLYMIIVPLILFNILVAMITEAYVEVESDKYNHWRLNRSKLIVELEESMPYFIKARFYPSSTEVEIQEFEQQKEGDDNDQQEAITHTLEEIRKKMETQRQHLFETLDRQERLEKVNEDTIKKLLAQRENFRKKLD